MSSPYRDLSSDAFWRTGALTTHPLAPQELYQKSFEIDRSDKILTAGSCFAQHIARALDDVGVTVMDYEPPPSIVDARVARKFGYLTYSARYANIYSARQLLQLLQEAFEGRVSPDPVWEKGGAYYDSMRPSVEPLGLDSADLVLAHRREHLSAVRRLVEDVDVFIYTLGLTECWGFRGTDWIFPTAPGTIAGRYDPNLYHFVNLRFEEILSDIRTSMAIIRSHSKSDNVRFLFTVSPVPLAATYSGEHISVATTYSKSVLRAVTGVLSAEDPNVGYFPSYEMVTLPLSRGIFYDANWRTVNQAGVQTIMSGFLDCHGLKKPGGPVSSDVNTGGIYANNTNAFDDIACEEALLDSFSAGERPNRSP